MRTCSKGRSAAHGNPEQNGEHDRERQSCRPWPLWQCNGHALNAPNIDSPTMPSNSSARGGTWRTASAIPTSSGATATMPSRQEPNQTRQKVKGSTVDSRRATRIAAPVAATADPMALASKNPSTWETPASLNSLPNHRSIKPVVRSAWRIDHSERNGKPSAPADHEIGSHGCDNYGGCH
jgi:hypothetical protein